MGILSKLMGKSSKDGVKVGGMEDFMTLIRVYFQAAIAMQLGINNLSALPDLRVFKTTLRVPTVNNRIGPGEKARCKKMLSEIYSLEDSFFKEIDRSIVKGCRKIQDVQVYLVMFQGFSQDLLMLTGNLMKFKLRVPNFFKKALRAMTEKTVHDIFTKNDYKDASVMKAVVSVREYSRKLGFSEQWTANYVYRIVMLAKKEPKPKEEENNKKKS